MYMYINSLHGEGVRKQHYFSLSPPVSPSSIHLSVTLSPPKPLCGIQPNLLHHFPSRPVQHYFPCLHLSVHLSVILSPLKPLGRIQPNLLHLILPLMVRMCKSNFIFPCVCSPSICQSRYLLLNHLAECIRTFYITSPHAKGGERNTVFSVHPSFVHLSVMLSPP